MARPYPATPQAWLEHLRLEGVSEPTAAAYGKVLRWAARALGCPLVDATSADWQRLPTPPATGTQLMRRRVLRRYLAWAGVDIPATLQDGTGRPGKAGPAPTSRRHAAGWDTTVDEWIQWLGSGSVGSATLAERRYQLMRLAADCWPAGPWDVDSDDLAAWLGGHRWSRESLRSYLAALRSFYGHAHAAGLIPTNPAGLLRKIPAVPGLPRPAGDGVIAAALVEADPRLYLMLMLGARHGLRRGEIAGIHSEDLTRSPNGESALFVHGKGSKTRLVPLLVDVAAAIRERPPGWLFPAPAGGHLTPRHVGRLISRGLPDGVAAHSLRHRFASSAYDGTRDIRAVQELLGHASVATTQVYTRVGSEAMRRAVEAASRLASYPD